MTTMEISKFRFVVFRNLFAAATLFHFHWTSNVLRVPPTFELLLASLLTLLSICVLSFRRVQPLFSLILVLICVDVMWLSPSVPNHWLLAGIISFAILLHSIVFRCDIEAGFIRARSSLLAMTASFYFFTFFWKLNSSFLQMDTSCAIRFLSDFDRWLPFSVQYSWNQILVVYGTLALELLLPLLILVPKTRGYAVVLGVIFHFFLGLHVEKMFLNFSSVMFALLWIIAPSRFIATLQAPELNSGIFSPKCWGKWLAIGYLLLFIFLLSATANTNMVFFLGRHVIWLVFGIVSVAVVMYMLLRLGTGVVEEGARRPTAIGWLLILTVLFNGLTPWFGLKTGSAWQMYSNLQISADNSNHLVINRSLDIFGKLADSVKVIDSEGLRVPLEGVQTVHELRRAAQATPNAVISYRESGVVSKNVRLGSDARFSKPLSLLERKLMRFHRLDSSNDCLW